MLSKILAILAVLFQATQQPIVEPPVFDGIRSNIIPRQCPVTRFESQCSQNEITRENAQRALNQLDHSTSYCSSEQLSAYCLIEQFESYSDHELKLLHSYVNGHTCFSRNVDRNRETADVLFRSRATSEELQQDRARYWNSNDPGRFCGKKKVQQRARRINHQRSAQRNSDD